MVVAHSLFRKNPALRCKTAHRDLARGGAETSSANLLGQCVLEGTSVLFTNRAVLRAARPKALTMDEESMEIDDSLYRSAV